MDELQKEKLNLKYQETQLEVREFLLSYSWFGRITLIVMILLFIPAYFIGKGQAYKAAHNSYEKSKITVHPAVLTFSPVEVTTQPTLLTVSQGNYAAYAQIHNPNPSLVAPVLQYTFNFIDAGGHEIKSFQDQTYMLSGEKKYIIAAHVSMAVVPTTVTLTIADPDWKNRLIIPNVTVQTGIPVFSESSNPTQFVVDGAFTNLSAYTLAHIKIVALVQDFQGNIIGVNQYLANDLLQKERRAYHMTWPSLMASKVGSIKIFSDVNVLDWNNLR